MYGVITRKGRCIITVHFEALTLKAACFKETVHTGLLFMVGDKLCHCVVTVNR